MVHCNPSRSWPQSSIWMWLSTKPFPALLVSVTDTISWKDGRCLQSVPLQAWRGGKEESHVNHIGRFLPSGMCILLYKHHVLACHRSAWLDCRACCMWSASGHGKVHVLCYASSATAGAFMPCVSAHMPFLLCGLSHVHLKATGICHQFLAVQTPPSYPGSVPDALP